MAPVAIVGWLVVLAAYVGVAPGVPVELGRRGLAGLGMASVALAVAAIGSRFRSVASPGGVGLGVMAGLASGLHVVPVRWLEDVPSGTTTWPLVIAAALVIVAHSTREPASS